MNTVNNIGEALPMADQISLPLPFLVIVFILMIIFLGTINAILWFHWQRYSENRQVKIFSLAINFIVSFIFFITMFISLLSYSSGI